MEVVLRVALNRLGANEASLKQLIKAVVPSKPKANGIPGTVDLINVLFDILLDGFRMKTKMPPLTIKWLIEVGSQLVVKACSVTYYAYRACLPQRSP